MDGLNEYFCKSNFKNSAGFDRKIESFYELTENATEEEKDNWLQELKEQENNFRAMNSNPFDPIQNTNSFFN